MDGGSVGYNASQGTREMIGVVRDGALREERADDEGRACGVRPFLEGCGHQLRRKGGRRRT